MLNVEMFAALLTFVGQGMGTDFAETWLGWSVWW